jgi:hypothetical protein
MTRALFIPANSWHPVREVDVDTSTFDGIRAELGCRLVELVTPIMLDRDVPNLETHVLASDEEGRYVDGHMKNVRATELAGYPYYLVGDMLLFGDVDDNMSRRLVDYDPAILRHFQRT